MHKYKNSPTERIVNVEIVKFPSKAEAKYFDKLYKMAQSGEISELTLQPQYYISTAFTIQSTQNKSPKQKIGKLKYTPDFRYNKDGKTYVVEVKGVKTPSYQMRKKLFLFIAKHSYDVDVFIEAVGNNETTYQCDTVVSL